MRSIKKIVGQDNDWKECTFYEIELSYPPGNYKAIDWLRDIYGYPRYSVTWWKTVNSVWMRDDIYTHYKLCE